MITNHCELLEKLCQFVTVSLEKYSRRESSMDHRTVHLHPSAEVLLYLDAHNENTAEKQSTDDRAVMFFHKTVFFFIKYQKMLQMIDLA